MFLNVRKWSCYLRYQISSDDFYLGENGLQGLNTTIEQNAYLWAQDIYQWQQITDWSRMYQQVFYCNVVLEGLEKMGSAERADQVWKELKGTAMFYRSLAFYNLAQCFAAPYSQQNAGSELGIPLRLSADLNIRVPRASLAASYSQVIEDLKAALELLPKNQVVLTRPSRNAALALMARVHLVMADLHNSAFFVFWGPWPALRRRRQALQTQIECRRALWHSLQPSQLLALHKHWLGWLTPAQPHTKPLLWPHTLSYSYHASSSPKLET
ncbi:MAG: hypothetical protein EOO39_30235 [Cytophagaceae bacterium]|nr:MAG: hypothetical protein EOO39_30235 [Cytophagaceae bacterium]